MGNSAGSKELSHLLQLFLREVGRRPRVTTTTGTAGGGRRRRNALTTNPLPLGWLHRALSLVWHLRLLGRLLLLLLRQGIESRRLLKQVEDRVLQTQHLSIKSCALILQTLSLSSLVLWYYKHSLYQVLCSDTTNTLCIKSCALILQTLSVSSLVLWYYKHSLYQVLCSDTTNTLSIKSCALILQTLSLSSLVLWYYNHSLYKVLCSDTTNTLSVKSCALILQSLSL